MSFSRIKEALTLNNIASVIDHSLVSLLPIVTADVAKYQGIEDTRALDASTTKDTIKHDFSVVSGIVNIFCLTKSFLPSASVILQTWSELNWKQRAAVSAAALIGVGGSAYSLSVFGIEEHTMTAGGAATLGCSSFKLAGCLAVKFHSDNNSRSDREEVQLLGEPKSSRRIRPFGRN